MTTKRNPPPLFEVTTKNKEKLEMVKVSDIGEILNQFQTNFIQILSESQENLKRNSSESHQNFELNNVFILNRFQKYYEFLHKHASENIKMDLEYQKVLFLESLKAGDIDSANSVIECLSIQSGQIKTIAKNRLHQPERWNDDKILSEYQSLINVLKSKKHLKRAKLSLPYLYESIPNKFISYLDEQGIRSKSGSVYTREMCLKTLDALKRKKESKRQNSFIYKYRVQLFAFGFMFFWLLLFASLYYGLPKWYKTATKKAVITSSIAITAAKDDVQKCYTWIFENGKDSFAPKFFSDKQEFYNYYAPLFVATCRGTNLDARVPLVQAYIETGGKSKLFIENNNILGLKAGKRYTGKTVLIETSEHTTTGKEFTVNQKFKSFDNVKDCINEYLKLLDKKAYKGILNKTNIDGQIKCLRPYSTNKDYIKLIKNEVDNLQIN